MQQKGDGEPEEQLDGDGHGGEVRGVTERGPESSVLQEEAKVREADEALLVEDDDGAMEAEPRRRENGHDGDAGENSGGRCGHQGALTLRLHRGFSRWSTMRCARESASAGERRPAMAAESSPWMESLASA